MLALAYAMLALAHAMCWFLEIVCSILLSLGAEVSFYNYFSLRYQYINDVQVTWKVVHVSLHNEASAQIHKGHPCAHAGPAHFLQGTCKKVMDRARLSTLLKRRHLTWLGYQVISVPYWEWEQLSTMRERARYLENLLRSVMSSAGPTYNVQQSLDSEFLRLRGWSAAQRQPAIQPQSKVCRNSSIFL